MAQLFSADDVHAIPVGQLFKKDSARYSIPLYQRNYTWGEEQIHRLINDILDEAEKFNSKDYFLGNLVVAPPAEYGDPFDVIDGQQRLTTLFMVLSKLRNMQVSGELSEPIQPPTYEARDKATRALRIIADNTVHSGHADELADGGILHAATIIDQLLQGPEMATRFSNEHVINYLLHRVMIVRMPIARTTDLNHYFEIMNTRGTQLSPVDIVKARLLSQLKCQTDRVLLNKIWTACSDMDRYVVMTVTAQDTQLRNDVFGPRWTDVPTSDFYRLRGQLVEGQYHESAHGHGYSPTSDSHGLTFDEALSKYSQANMLEHTEEPETNERFTSQISFPTFLLHVLALYRDDQSEDTDDRQLDDKQLVSRFTQWLEQHPETESKEQKVQRFTTDLLRVRFLFDIYILKREATLTHDHESTTDEEPGSWSLYELVRAPATDQGKEKSKPHYKAPFSRDESDTENGTLQQRVLLMQSALRITYTSPRTMHWMTEALRHVTAQADLSEPGQGLLGVLEDFARKRLAEAIDDNSPNSTTEPKQFPTGFSIPRIVFTYLDYLLVDEMNKWDFTFSYRTSIEHFSPRKEDTEHATDATQVKNPALLDWFGNLALVTVSENSKFSNYQPAQKASNMPARRRSLKLERMAQQALKGNWADEEIEQHHDEMANLLLKALGRVSD